MRVLLLGIGMASIIITQHLPSVSPHMIHGTGGTADGILMIHSGAELTTPPCMLAGTTGTHLCSTAIRTMATIIMDTLVAEDSVEPPALLATRGAEVLWL
jgi:hypothetical protein